MVAAILSFILARGMAPQIGKLSEVEVKMAGNLRLVVDPEAKEPVKKALFFNVYCENVCRGKKHLLHSECDASCDKACSHIHKETFGAVSSYSEDVSDLAKAIGSAKGLKDHMLYTDAYVALDKIIDQGLGQGKAREKYWVTIDWKHWAKDPCSYVDRDSLYWIYSVSCKWRIVKDGVDASGKPTSTEVKNGTCVVELKLPTDEYEDRKPVVRCACSVVQDGPDGGGGGDGGISHPEERTAFVEKCGPPMEVCSTQDLDKFGFEVVCANMNEGTCTATNYMPMPVDLCVQEGMQLECVDESAQDCVCVGGCRLHLPPANIFALTTGFGEPAMPVSAPIRLQCLNLHKDQPNRRIKYRPVLADSREIVALARFQKQQMIGGPWDQIRTWIYTDHASLDEIGKVILPPPTEGAYLKAAYQVSTVLPRFDFSAPENRRCLEPRLIAGNVAGREATLWLVRQLDRIDPNGLAQWVNANPAAFAPLWTNTSLTVNPKHLADVASALLQSDEPVVREAGIQFLLKTVPVDKRDLVLKNNGFEGMNRALIRCSDSEEAGRLLDVVEAYKEPAATFGLRNMRKELPANIRDRAARLLDALGG